VSRVDGSWRDIYVLGTTEADWDAMLGLVKGGDLGSYWYFVDGDESPLPDRVASVFCARETASPEMELKLEGLLLKCYFFTDVQIEFDLDPAELTEESFASLLAWMRGLGALLRKDVRLTPESMPASPLLVFHVAMDRFLVVSESAPKE
jgi:hypothetical protein